MITLLRCCFFNVRVPLLSLLSFIAFPAYGESFKLIELKVTACQKNTPTLFPREINAWVIDGTVLAERDIKVHSNSCATMVGHFKNFSTSLGNIDLRPSEWTPITDSKSERFIYISRHLHSCQKFIPGNVIYIGRGMRPLSVGNATNQVIRSLNEHQYLYDVDDFLVEYLPKPTASEYTTIPNGLFASGAEDEEAVVKAFSDLTGTQYLIAVNRPIPVRDASAYYIDMDYEHQSYFVTLSTDPLHATQHLVLCFNGRCQQIETNSTVDCPSTIISFATTRDTATWFATLFNIELEVRQPPSVGLSINVPPDKNPKRELTPELMNTGRKTLATSKHSCKKTSRIPVQKKQ